MGRSNEDSQIALVLSELKHMTSQQKELKDQVEGIAESMVVMSVQTEQITTLQKNVAELWDKYDGIASPEGPLVSLQKAVAACPKESLETSINRVWKSFYVLVGVSISALGLMYKILKP